MILNNDENNVNQNGSNSTVPNEFNVVLTVVKVVIVAVFLLPLAEYSVRMKNNETSTEIDQLQNMTIDVLEETRKIVVESTTENVDFKKKTVQTDNSCSQINMIVILDEIIMELIEKSEFCTPEDFSNINKHKIPKSIIRNYKKGENKFQKAAKVPAIVNYAVGIVLMVSLGAALLELYKAKRQPAKKDGKNSLSRKCSLADLTVMKHHRKEMTRRESLLEIPEENLYSKQLGKRPTSLHRQCSFPVGPSSLPTMTTNPKCSISGRRLSMQSATRYVPVVDGRPAAVLEGRRHSLITDGRQPLIVIEGSRRISLDRGGMLIDNVDDSPDRRYHVHGRRVHRH